MEKNEMDEFESLAKPLVKYLNDKFNPHTIIIIESNGAEILSGECRISIPDYIPGLH